MIPTTRMNRRTWWSLIAGLATLLALGLWAIGANGNRSERPPAGADQAAGGNMEGMATSSDGSAHLTAEQIRQFGVTFAIVEERTISGEVRTVGVVNFDETRLAVVAPKFSGYVERLHVDFTGQPVHRRQALLEIYSPELVAGQQELLLARRLQQELGTGPAPGVPAGATDLVGAARRRLRLWDISEAQIERILTSGEPQRTLTLYAPVSGVVIEKNVLAGQAVGAGQTLYTIADLSEVWVEAELRQSDAAVIQEGAPATVDFTALPGRSLAGRVEYVYPTLQEQARTLKARIAVANPGGQLKPGMYATVRMGTPQQTALAIPSQAIINTGERTVVFVDMGGGSLMPHEVEVGRIAGDYSEVLAGLEPGQRVVTSAQYLLDSESSLAETMKSMIGMGRGGMDSMDLSGEAMDMQGADMRGMDMPAAGK